MKKLKLNHELATRISRGDSHITWRLFDDKDLSVNDTVELIDKVNPQEPQTWRVIGIAKINKVIEKRLGDIRKSDAYEYQEFSSSDRMLTTYREYYGPNVGLDTPVKIVFFNLEPYKNSEIRKNSKVVEMVTSDLKNVKIYADGGSRGNPGPSASGFVVMDMKNVVLIDKGIYLGITTNNQAEYQALKFALEEVQKMHLQTVEVYMDSLLVINQMKGVFKVKNRDLLPIHDAIKGLLTGFQSVSFTHVPREFNKLADAAVNRALDEALGIAPKRLS